MLDLHFIRTQPDLVREAIRQKNIPLDLTQLLALDDKARTERAKIQELERQRNANAVAVPQAKRDDKSVLIAKGRALAEELRTLKAQAADSEAKLYELMLLVPAIPAKDAPVGQTDSDNVELRRRGTPRTFDFPAKNHVELLTQLGWADFERVPKIAGTRSYSLQGAAAFLELALLQWTLSFLQARGFTPITVPALAREPAFLGTGHFPTGRDQTYAIPEDDLFLAGTGEVLLHSLHAGEILQEDMLPLRYAGISPCFRREAGSAGRDTRGLFRVHQFWKVEQYVITTHDPNESERRHAELLQNSEDILQALEIPYRVMAVCTGDMGPGKYRQHDLEAWVPSEGRYRETHSCSTLHDWQARRVNLRYRDRQGKVQFCHTLNNTGIATPRILVPLLENHQQADGSISLPKLPPTT